MNELNLQKMILKNLKKTFKEKKYQIKEEQANGLGSTDIVISSQKINILIEVKLLPNNTLFSQLERQKLVGTHLVAITNKPKTEQTSQKWIEFAEKQGINLIYFSDKKIPKKKLLRIPNDSFDEYFFQGVRRIYA